MMEQEIKRFVDRPFDCKIVEELDMASIEAALDEGNKCLHYQFETIGRVNRNCAMILSWLVGVIVALIGFVAVEGTSDAPELALLITAGYELVFSIAIVAILIHGALYKRTTFYPGTSPSHFCRDSVLESLKGFENKSKYMVGWHLADVQFKIMQNEEEQMRVVLVYRKALALMAISLGTGAILLATLLMLL